MAVIGSKKSVNNLSSRKLSKSAYSVDWLLSHLGKNKDTFAMETRQNPHFLKVCLDSNFFQKTIHILTSKVHMMSISPFIPK